MLLLRTYMKLIPYLLGTLTPQVGTCLFKVSQLHFADLLPSFLIPSLHTPSCTLGYQYISSTVILSIYPYLIMFDITDMWVLISASYYLICSS